MLDILFPPDVETGRYLTRMTLRFGDTNTQYVVLTHPVYPPDPAGKPELVSYSIEGLGNSTLGEFISKAKDENPKISDIEIAQKLRVAVTRSQLDYGSLQMMMNGLNSIRISPNLRIQGGLDDFSEFDFWFDTGEESVHYTITGVFNGNQQDKLVHWMIAFREGLPILTHGPGPGDLFRSR